MAERLTQQEAAYIYGERRGVAMHVGMVVVFQGQLPYDFFRDLITAIVDSGMNWATGAAGTQGHIGTRFRKRIVPVPFGLAHPTWEDDPNFDIENHIRHVAVPAPGTEAQFQKLAADLFAPPLDRSKPLWEVYLITGLEGDRSALLFKAHHAMTKTPAREGEDADEPQNFELGDLPEGEAWQPAPPPSDAKRLLDGVLFTLGELFGMFRGIAYGLLHPREVIERVQTVRRTIAKTSSWLRRPAPETPWSRNVGPGRRIARAMLSFPDAREVRAVYGGTINDIILSVLTGALRKYLMLHNWDVNGPELRIAVPFNPSLMRGGGVDNERRGMLTPVPIGEADPVKRLRIIQERMNKLKEENQAAALDTLSRMLSFAPAPVHKLLSVLPVRNRAFNMICTNVPGARATFSLNGHEQLEQYALVPLNPGIGLGGGVFSYVNKLFFALTADSAAVPDLDVLKGFIEESFAELVAAARAAAPATDGVSPNGASPDGKEPSETQAEPSEAAR